MKKLTLYGLLLTVFFVSGCVTRVIPRDVKRVDQDLKGNRGMIMGEAAALPERETKKTRTVYDVEVELFSPGERVVVKEKEAPEPVEGNKGYLKRTGVTSREDVKKEEVIRLQSFAAPKTPKVIYKPRAGEKEDKTEAVVQQEKAPKIYIVEKGDTLQKISDKVYGTTRRWQEIYEANKDVLKSPDKIVPGQKLVIPE
jgi:LysM repeat protein